MFYSYCFRTILIHCQDRGNCFTSSIPEKKVSSGTSDNGTILPGTGVSISTFDAGVSSRYSTNASIKEMANGTAAPKTGNKRFGCSGSIMPIMANTPSQEKVYILVPVSMTMAPVMPAPMQERTNLYLFSCATFTMIFTMRMDQNRI